MRRGGHTHVQVGLRMARSPLFRRLLQVAGVAQVAERRGLNSDQAVRLRDEHAEAVRGWTRRQVLGVGASALLASAMTARDLQAAPKASGLQAKVAILGGGLAGLVAADRLATAGIAATLYEASDRLGGRQKSLRGFFPGQVAELGGELIDNLHKTMLGYANAFGLTLEDLGKAPGEESYFFDGALRSPAEVVDEFRIFAKRAQVDFHASSGAPTAFAYNDADVALDNLSLTAFLDKHAADLPLARAVLIEAYEAEYGVAAEAQSALGLILFVHFDRRSRFTPFGVFSDERYHVVEGNDAIASGIAQGLPGAVVLGAKVVQLGRNADGRYRIHLAGQKQPELADAVICTLPFSVLRQSVVLEASLGLQPGKRFAINNLSYGTNTKTMIGFDGRPWAAYGSKGTAYSDLSELQACWETNYSLAGARAILTDYGSGPRGAELGTRPLQSSVQAFLADLENVWPGVSAAAHREKAAIQAVRAPWPIEPLQLGSYTGYAPGQFTSICGWEGTAEGLLKFGGEHADSFYSWQGFMEGACLSGLRTAEEILADVKAKRLV